MKVSRQELRLKQAGAFRKSAGTLIAQIEAKRHPAISEQNLTARRARIASSMGDDADHLERIKQALEGMATDLEKNQLSMVLRPVTTRGMVEALLQKRRPTPGVHKSHVRDVLRICKKSRETAVLEARKSVQRLMAGDRHECYLELKSLKQLDAMLILNRAFLGGSYSSLPLQDLTLVKRFFVGGIRSADKWATAHEALMVYINGPSPQQIKEKQLKEMEHGLIGMKIPGFFPTPKSITDTMVQMANIRAGHTVLEPSAGKGDIAEAIKRDYPKAKLTTIEYNWTLSEILKAKGFKVTSGDFLEHTGCHDRIIMNPPFENGQDIDHVRWAYSRLKPGGKLVSIMCEGPFFRNDKKAKLFRQWFKDHAGRSCNLASGVFQGKESFNQTGVSSRIVTLEK